MIGKFLVLDEVPVPCDAAVVLNTGVEYYPRIMEAANLYRQGYVKKIVIDGNRKTDSLRELEKMGFESCCKWYEDRLRIFELLDVPRDDVSAISAEDVYDTVGEAEVVGHALIERQAKQVLIVTSKYHTRRASYIWTSMYKEKMKIRCVSAKEDPYDPRSWWKEGRQIRWVLAEYGAWLYYLWKIWLT